MGYRSFLKIVFIIFQISIVGFSLLRINATTSFAGKFCVYRSYMSYVCGATDECGTGASCGALCDNSNTSSHTVNCGGSNGCDYQCSNNPPPEPDTTPPACDTANPGGIIISPWPVKSGVGNISITAKASDDRGIKSAGLYIRRPNGSLIGIRGNGDETGFSTDGNSKQFTSTWASENTYGSYQIQANWTDTSNNFKQCVQDFVIDKDSPVCGTWTFSQPSPTNASSINITTTATDGGSGITTGGIYYLGPLSTTNPPNTAIYPNNQSTNGTMTVSNFATPADGKYTFQANWWDAFGNFNQCKYDYIFNKNPPTTSISGPTQICLGSTGTYSMTAYAKNGLDISYFTYYKPSTSSWQTSPFPLYQSGLSGTSFSGSGNIAFTSGNGFAAGNNYYVASGSYDDLGMKCSGNQLLFPTNPNTIYSGSAWNYCGDASRLTVSVIDKPSAVTNLTASSTTLSQIILRWDGVSQDKNQYTVTNPSGTQLNNVYCGINRTNSCLANISVWNCVNDYTFTVSENNACGAGSSRSVTGSSNCLPSCSLSFQSGSNPFRPNSTVTIASTSNAGDPGDYIADYNWFDDGPDKGYYIYSDLDSAQYRLINRYGATTRLRQWVRDLYARSYVGSCNLTVRTEDPTISVGPVPSVSIIKSASNTVTQKNLSFPVTLLNDNGGTLTTSQAETLTHNGSSYSNICKQSGVTCSFSNISSITSSSVGKSVNGVNTGMYITVPRSLPSGTYAYGLELSSTKWDNVTPLFSQSINLVTVNNLSPICSKPTLSEYSTYSASGYPRLYGITVSAAGVVDYDGSIALYTWDDTPPGSGVISPTSTNGSTTSTTYTTPNAYGTTNYISYSVRDNNNSEVVCPTSDPITTLLQPGVSPTWFNYSIDINKTLTDVQNFTWTQSGVSVGNNVVANYAIDTTAATINNKPNICNISGVSCKFNNNLTSVTNEIVSPSGTPLVATATRAVTITIPNNLALRNDYQIRITGKTTYRGIDSDIDRSQTIVISASTSDISLTCKGGSSTSPCYTFSTNRAWDSGNLEYSITSNKFVGTYDVTIDTSDTNGLCSKSGVTCSVVSGTGSLSSDQTKSVYLKVVTTNSVAPGTYDVRLKAVGTRSVVGSKTDLKYSPTTSITLVNQPPTCTTPTLSEYTTYSVPGYPKLYSITVTGSGSDVDGTVNSTTGFEWGGTSSPSGGTLGSSTSSSVTYTTANVNNFYTTISYRVKDNNDDYSIWCISPSFHTLIFPTVEPTWNDYAIDISNSLTNTQVLTVTETATNVGYDVNTKFTLSTGQYLNGSFKNICYSGLGTTCEIIGVTGLSVNDTIPGVNGNTSRDYSIKVSVPNNIPTGSYRVGIISANNTYRGSTIYWSQIKTVNIIASPSTISVVCGDGSTGPSCPPNYSENRGWVSNPIRFKVLSNGFNGTFTVNPYVSAPTLCAYSGITCTFSTSSNGTYTSSLSGVALTSTGATSSKDIYMKISSSKSTPPVGLEAKFVVNGTRSTVLSTTGNKNSPDILVALNNQAPTCGTPTVTYDPASPAALGSTVTVTVGGGTDPDNDALTYSDWTISSARSITAATDNSATAVLYNIYDNWSYITYKVRDSYSGVSAACSIPALRTIVDSVPPQATLTSAASSICKGLPYLVTYAFTDNDVLKEVSINKKDPVEQIGTKSGSFGSSTSLSATTTFSSAGIYYVYPTAKDANNNVCDSSGSISCGAGTLKEVTVNENSSAPAMSFITFANNATKVRVTWTKPDALGPGNYTFTRASGTAGTISSITCSGNDCGVDITGLNCTSSYSYNLLERDENTCNATSTISGVSPNCAPQCGAPTIKSSDIPSSGLYPLNTSVTINSNKKSGQSSFDDEDGNSITHIWAPSLSGTGLGGITAGGADATYLTPNRNNLTVSVIHSIRDSGGPNDNNFVTVTCGAVNFPMISDGLSTPVFSPGSVSIERKNISNPTGSSNFTYSLTNFQAGTFAIDTTNTSNASFIGNNICALTNLVTCSANSTAPVGVGQSIPITVTFKDGARSNFNTIAPYKVKGVITYTTTNSANVSTTKSASAYLNVSIVDNAPTCKVYSRLNTNDSWVDVTGKYFTYSSGTKVYIRTVGSDSDGDSIGSYGWVATTGAVNRSTVQDTYYTMTSALSSQITATVRESAPNTLTGSCSTIMKTPDPGTHTLPASTTITSATSSISIPYSYSGYVNANFDGTNVTGVDGASTISTGTIAGKINICTVTGVTCAFEGQSSGEALTIASGTNSSTNVLVSWDPTVTKLDNLASYGIKINFTAPTADGRSITASTSGGAFSITDTSPVCGNISISPSSVLSGSTDAITITALGTDDWNMSSAKLEYNTNITGINTGTWTTISTISSFSSVTSPTASFSWQPGSLSIGRYLLRVTWTDNKNQSITCSALNSAVSSNPASPTDTNNPVVTVAGNHISGRVLIQSDASSSSNFYRPVSKDTLNTFLSISHDNGITSASASSWYKSVGSAGGASECRASYPNRVADADNCLDYFVSTDTFASGDSIVTTVFNPVSTFDSSVLKYSCTYDVWKRNLDGTRDIVQRNGTNCYATVTVEPGDSSYSDSSRWTTEVDFYLTYNTDRVYGRVQNYAGAGLNGYDIYGSYGVKSTTAKSGSTDGLYAYPSGSDSKEYLPDVPRSFALSKVNDPLGTDASSEKCFYAFNNRAAPKSSHTFSTAEIRTIARGGTLSGWTTGEGCTTPELPILHGTSSPQFQNYLYFFVVPKITVDSNSTVKLASACTAEGKSSATILPDTEVPPTIKLFASDGTTQVGDGVYDSTTGKFSIVDTNNTSISKELLWNNTYVADVSTNVNYIVCNNRTPSFRVGTASSEPNVINSALTNYPSGTSSENKVLFDFYIAPKNNNDWWQVYDAGAHANGIMDLVKLPEIYDATSGSNIALPLVENITTGALVSSSDTGNDINFNEGKAGNSPYEWFANRNNSEMAVPYNDDLLDSISGAGSGWVQKNNFVSALSSANSDFVYVDGDQEHTNMSNKNKHARPIAVLGDLLISDNLLLNSSSSGPLIILVKGNVTISYQVQTIQAIIYATGNITIQTHADETDPQIIITGSLIADSLNFKRDLPNSPLNNGRPSHVVSYDPRVFSLTSIPDIMKEANAYWVVAD